MAAVTPEEYVATTMASIDGWFQPHDAVCFILIDRIHRGNGIAGNLVEVGVWRGKSLGLLATLRRPGERLYGFDLFTEDTTVDLARQALLKAAGDRDAATLLAADTQQMAPAAVLAAVERPVRFLHVDGGHRYEQALGDLRKFGALVGERGVIAVDDYYDRDFPGVAAATADFTRETDFVPFLAGDIKLFLCRAPLAESYIGAFLGLAAFRDTSHVARFRDRPMLVSSSSKAEMYRASVEEFLARTRR